MQAKRRRVVELRVHGVGGSTPEGLLGESSSADTVRVGGEGKSAFFARGRDRSVEGYVWGPLTTHALVQPLWILLLPFTLANVAGWTLPPISRSRGPSWKIARVLVALLGLTLTIGFVFGLAAIVVKVLFYQWGLNGLVADPEWRLRLGSLAMIVLGAGVFLIARTKQGGFEMVTSAKPFDEPERRGAVGALVHECVQRSDGPTRGGLTEKGFWAHRRAARQLLWLHAGAWLGATAVVYLRAREFAAAAHAATEPEDLVLGFRFLYVVLGTTELILILALLATLLLGFKRPFEVFTKPGYRWFAPVVAPTAAIALAAGFLSGLAAVVAAAIQRWSGSEQVTIGGPEFNLNFAFGMAVVALVVTALVMVAVLVGPTFFARDRDLPNRDVAPAGEGPSSIPNGTRGRVRRARALSELGRNADFLLTLPALLFAAVAVPTLADMARGEFAMDFVPWLTAAGIEQSFDFIARAGGGIAVGLTGVVLYRLIRRGSSANQRRQVGILWDVLTFWPRRFHPLAVRPYAERAVPELIGRIMFHVRRGRRVVLSAHSQGTILAYAALAQISRHAGEVSSRVALITYGSPLTQLHGHFFSAFFDPVEFTWVRSRLFHDDLEPSASWTNFWRRTDYIGKHVLLEPSEAMFNVEVPDPRSGRNVGDIPWEEELARYPDPERVPWVDLALHSHYNSEPLLKGWLADVKARLDADSRSSVEPERDLPPRRAHPEQWLTPSPNTPSDS